LECGKGKKKLANLLLRAEINRQSVDTDARHPFLFFVSVESLEAV
jgi:hypothetical protein